MWPIGFLNLKVSFLVDTWVDNVKGGAIDSSLLIKSTNWCEHGLGKQPLVVCIFPAFLFRFIVKLYIEGALYLHNYVLFENNR